MKILIHSGPQVFSTSRFQDRLHDEWKAIRHGFMLEAGFLLR